ncbi:hypothetical protein D3D01_21295 [Haloarcula sp. Atlit-7R]|nr:hypothetical protein D3D01_21295 [Haloarcula sp. Atlit-7R]
MANQESTQGIRVNQIVQLYDIDIFEGFEFVKQTEYGNGRLGLTWVNLGPIYARIGVILDIWGITTHRDHHAFSPAVHPS